MVCNLCRKSVEDVRYSGYYSCVNAESSCDFDCCTDCFRGKKQTFEEFLKLLDPKVLQNIVLKNPKTKIHSHVHNIRKNNGTRPQGWNCDKITGSNVCLSGLTDFYQSDGIPSYYCDECSFDMCEKCMLADIHIFKG